MSFKEKKYTVIKNVISNELAKFCYDYFLLKRKVAKTLFDEKFIAPIEHSWGTWNDEQVPNTYSHYSDIVMETLLQKVKSIMEKETQLKLNETYSYARIYKKGDILERHKDRFSCEISTTLHLGGDEWSIFVEPTGLENKKGIEIKLKPGDMLIYRGMELEHWREKFDGENCAQVFLHYNDVNSVDSDVNKYDTRPHLGLPAWFKNNK
jgi:hypothetical protein